MMRNEFSCFAPKVCFSLQQEALLDRRSHDFTIKHWVGRKEGLLRGRGLLGEGLVRSRSAGDHGNMKQVFIFTLMKTSV